MPNGYNSGRTGSATKGLLNQVEYYTPRTATADESTHEIGEVFAPNALVLGQNQDNGQPGLVVKGKISVDAEGSKSWIANPSIPTIADVIVNTQGTAILYPLIIDVTSYGNMVISDQSTSFDGFTDFTTRPLTVESLLGAYIKFQFDNKVFYSKIISANDTIVTGTMVGFFLTYASAGGTTTYQYLIHLNINSGAYKVKQLLPQA